MTDAGSNYGFAGLTPRVRSATIRVLRAIYYPATSTGYWFGDADSYSPYGVLRKVSERRAMTFSGAPLDQQGTITAGYMSREAVYNYPMSGPLYDTPTYTEMTEDWGGRDTASAPVTYYSVVDYGAVRRTTITRPDGRRTEQDTDDDPNSPYYGLLTEDRTYAGASSLTPLQQSTVEWEIGAYGAPRPQFTEVRDEKDQLTKTTYSYYSTYNQIENKNEFGYGGSTQLHRVRTEYENGIAYTGYLANSGQLWWHPGGALCGGPQWSGPHIFSLPKLTEVYAGSTSTRVARTDYAYDQATLLARSGVAHLTSAPAQRGNLTSTTRYADAAGLNGSTAFTETREYDVCGNVVKTTTACCQQTTFTYAAATEYTWSASVTRGHATDASKQNTSSAVYDFNTGLVKASTDANGRTSNTVYQTNTLRPLREYAPTDAYAYHIYDDASLVVYDFTYEAGKSDHLFASRSDRYLDGHGRVRVEVAYGAGYTPDYVFTQYDNLGRLWKQSRPYRTGDPPFHVYEYDKLDRTTKVTAPDGSIVERFYNEATYPSGVGTDPGQTVRAKDAWNRERWARFDAQNRLVQVVEPDPSGTGEVATNGLSTSYAYDTLGNLTETTQGDQTRSFKYDGMSRLTHQKLAERSATLNDSGVRVGTPSGAWSDVFSYDTRSNLTQRVDARGVKTIFGYASDPLNRLQSVQYDKSSAYNPTTIPNAPNVSYDYVTNGDKTRAYHVYVDDGMGNQTFGYDSEGRLTQTTQTFTDREGDPLETNYQWDTLDRLSELTYPLRHGTTDTLRKKAIPTYDLASRLNALTYDGATYASAIEYNAASQTTSLTVDNPLSNTRRIESYSYQETTGLLTQQAVTRVSNSQKLLDLKYNYTATHDANNAGAKTGQLTGVTDLKTSSRSRAFFYDRLGRLTEIWGGTNAPTDPVWWHYYGYDRYGNRTWVSRQGPQASSIPLDAVPNVDAYNSAFSYQDAAQQNKTLTNRITTAGYEYDDAGNLTKGQTASGAWQRYKYDAAGRLAEVLTEGYVLQASYSYGASNQRLMSVEGSTTRYYGWEGGQVIAELDAAGASDLNWSKRFVYLGGRLLATSEASGVQYHHPNQLGTQLATNDSGAVTSEQVNMPYGTASTGESSGTNPSRRRFTSYDRSATTGLDYAVNRFYQPAHGRFTQVDPIGMEATDLENPQTLNLYAYCGNDPINHTDPDGLLFGWIGKAFKWAFRIGAVIVAVVAVAALSALGQYWGSIVITKAIVAKLFASAALLATAGWAPGKTGQIAGALATSGLSLAGRFRTPSTFPQGGGVSGVSSFLQQEVQEGKRLTLINIIDAVVKEVLPWASDRSKQAKCLELAWDQFQRAIPPPIRLNKEWLPNEKDWTGLVVGIGLAVLTRGRSPAVQTAGRAAGTGGGGIPITGVVYEVGRNIPQAFRNMWEREKARQEYSQLRRKCLETYPYQEDSARRG